MKFGLRELIFVLLLVASPVGAYFWVFKPANEQIQQRQAAAAANTQKITACRQALEVVDDLNAELGRYQEAVAFFESKLPAHHEVHKVLDQVTKIAQQHHLETNLFQTQPAKDMPQAKYSEQPIKVQIYGNFDNYYEFLLDVEKMPRITKIKNMRLEKKDKVNDGMMNATFTLSIFYIETEKQA